MHELLPWLGFMAFVLAMLALDLGIFNRKSHVISVRQAATWTGVWVGLAVLFNVGVYYAMGPEKGLQWTTGYVIEEALSVDNIFVFVLLMACFRVPAELQHKLLFWGVLGTLIMRGGAIAAGVYLLHHFHWIFYVFGVFLLYTGFRMFVQRDDVADPDKIPIVHWLQRYLPVTHTFHGGKFFVRDSSSKLTATPLVPALISIEITDLIFAVDSIPAIFAITEDAFIVYTSNVFAILGLRSLYFLIASAVTKFHYLKFGLAIVLCFVGTKMVIKDLVHIPIGLSLAVIVCVLGGAILYSLTHPVKPRCEPLVEPREKATSGRE